jgi:hypothetical protein
METTPEILKLQKRMLLFLVGCIGTRAFMVYIAKQGSILVKRILGIATLLMGLGFYIIYFGGYRKNGLETQGAPIWWNDLRPIHGLLYLTFSYMVFFTNYTDSAWVVLLVDLLFGLLSFLVFHYTRGNIRKVMMRITI